MPLGDTPSSATMPKMVPTISTCKARLGPRTRSSSEAVSPKTAAVELGMRGIRCNAVAPGMLRTPMLSPGHILDTLAKQLATLGRVSEVDDLVGVYHCLASDESRYVTGHTMVVASGRSTAYRKAVLARLAN